MRLPALLLAFVAMPAFAVPIHYEFTLTALTGPLAGQSSTGAFTMTPIESSLFGGLVTREGVFDDFDFAWGGEEFTELKARWGWASFVNGQLTGVALGNNCGAGYCSLDRKNAWLAYGHGQAFYSLGNDGYGTARATFASVPEPATIFLLGLACLVLLKRRLHGHQILTTCR